MKKTLDEMIPPIPASQVRKIAEKLNGLSDDAPISFAFLMTATFPTVWDNIQKYTNDCYMEGYLAGREAAKNDTKRNG